LLFFLAARDTHPVSDLMWMVKGFASLGIGWNGDLIGMA
jgi:hypothetical protein